MFSIKFLLGVFISSGVPRPLCALVWLAFSFVVYVFIVTNPDLRMCLCALCTHRRYVTEQPTSIVDAADQRRVYFMEASYLKWILESSLSGPGGRYVPLEMGGGGGRTWHLGVTLTSPLGGSWRGSPSKPAAERCRR